MLKKEHRLDTLTRKHSVFTEMVNITEIKNVTTNCGTYEAYFVDVPRDIHFDNFLLAMIVTNAVMAAVASCSNAVVIYTISRTPSLQTPSNILILGLAISDFGVAVILQTTYCLFKFSEFSRSVYLFVLQGKPIFILRPRWQLYLS